MGQNISKIKILLTTLSIILVNQYSFVHAWNGIGHRWIASLAWPRMTPAAQKMAFTLLTSGIDSISCDASIFENKSNPEKAFIEAAGWLDCSRGSEPIPIFKDYVHADRYPLCPAMLPPEAPRASNELKKAITELANHNNPIVTKRTALKVIIHLVGDLHQPLHTATTFDHVGNQTQVKPYPGEKPISLHKYWDFNVIDMAKKDKNQVATLVKKESRQMEKGIWDEWEMETIMQANSLTYKELMGDTMCAKPSKDIILIPPQYAMHATQLGRLKIVQAGVRLALILNLVSIGQAQGLLKTKRP
jgi:hypothetical protein